MTRLALTYFFLHLFLSSSALASTIEQVFIPQGFDDNDNVQIVVEGFLPSTCQRVSGTSVKKESEYEISVDVSYGETNKVCLPVTIPFYRVVDLGTLKSGVYPVRVGDQKMYHELKVGKSTSGQKDEILYANVTSGYVKNQTLTLKGIHPDSTFYVDNTKVTVQNNVIEILPIAKTTVDIGIFVTVPFEMSVDLSKMVKTGGTYLIHVRSLNGNALNLVESF